MLVIAPWPSSCLLRPHIRSMALRALQVVADYLAGPSRTGLATTCARLASSGLLQSLQAPTLSPAVTACSCSSVQQTSGLRTITDVHASREESSTAVFNGVLKARHRDRAAYLARLDLQLDGSGSGQESETPSGSERPTTRHGYRQDPLLRGVTDRLLDRLEDCKSRAFSRALVVGGAALHVLDGLAGGKAGVDHVTVVDTSEDMLKLVQAVVKSRTPRWSMFDTVCRIHCGVTRQDIAASEQKTAKRWPSVTCALLDPVEEMLPVEPGTYDLVVSSLGLHWVNDLPTFLAQCRFALKDDGLFLGAMFAGETLEELRISCAVSQMERKGGVSPVVSPFAQSMGETNAALHRHPYLGRDVALAASAVYQGMFGDPEDSSIPATYEVMFLTGWAPHESQQKPAQRGSATVSFQELATGLVGTGMAQGGSTGEADEEPTNESESETHGKKSETGGNKCESGNSESETESSKSDPVGSPWSQ